MLWNVTFSCRNRSIIRRGFLGNFGPLRVGNFSSKRKMIFPKCKFHHGDDPFTVKANYSLVHLYTSCFGKYRYSNRNWPLYSYIECKRSPHKTNIDIQCLIISLASLTSLLKRGFRPWSATQAKWIMRSSNVWQGSWKFFDMQYHDVFFRLERYCYYIFTNTRNFDINVISTRPSQGLNLWPLN